MNQRQIDEAFVRNSIVEIEENCVIVSNLLTKIEKLVGSEKYVQIEPYINTAVHYGELSGERMILARMTYNDICKQ